MSAPTAMNERKEKKLRCTDSNISETTNSKLLTQTGLPKNKPSIKTKNKLNGYRHISPKTVLVKPLGETNTVLNEGAITMN